MSMHKGLQLSSGLPRLTCLCVGAESKVEDLTRVRRVVGDPSHQARYAADASHIHINRFHVNW